MIGLTIIIAVYVARDRPIITALKSWIEIGAPAPAEEQPSPQRLDHWAFQPPVARPVPRIAAATRPRNPIDAFLGLQRDKRGLTANPPADSGILLRRVYVDLVGLPPTRAELLAFLGDRSDNAYEKAVDRLLASPHYGERWGRHWMDVWRYSDPDGRKAKKDTWWSNAHIWRWRDWIVRSLNQDKGYDRMLTEMLAGDEVAPDNPETLAATGFLVRSWFKLDRNIWLNNTVDHTAKAFMGLTINCARCHDHKFDPLSQKDYYRFRALFEPHDIRTDCLPIGARGPCEPVAFAYDLNPQAPTYVFVRGDVKTPDKSIVITPGLPDVLGGPGLCIQPISVRRKGTKPSTGRRLALAHWLCDGRNPLTARVAVNHVWLRHFGRPLVDNVYDFGLRSKEPEQLALLDWLAVEFMARDWSMKWLHRTMVTSAAYRMDSSARGASAANQVGDPDNRYYWRMNSRRLEAEAVRDALLCLSGTLDSKMSGPSLNCFSPPEPLRRSLYYRYSREDKMEFLTVFDAASVEECYRRQESIVPQQALALENSDFVWDCARQIARCLGDSAAASAFVKAAFEHLLGRSPDEREQHICERFLACQESLFSDTAHLKPLPPGLSPGVPMASSARGRARASLVHALLNHNDFITLR